MFNIYNIICQITAFFSSWLVRRNIWFYKHISKNGGKERTPLLRIHHQDIPEDKCSRALKIILLSLLGGAIKYSGGGGRKIKTLKPAELHSETLDWVRSSAAEHRQSPSLVSNIKPKKTNQNHKTHYSSRKLWHSPSLYLIF